MHHIHIVIHTLFCIQYALCLLSIIWRIARWGWRADWAGYVLWTTLCLLQVLCLHTKHYHAVCFCNPCCDECCTKWELPAWSTGQPWGTKQKTKSIVCQLGPEVLTLEVKCKWCHSLHAWVVANFLKNFYFHLSTIATTSSVVCKCECRSTGVARCRPMPQQFGMIWTCRTKLFTMKKRCTHSSVHNLAQCVLVLQGHVHQLLQLGCIIWWFYLFPHVQHVFGP